MRNDYERREMSVLAWLILANIAAFIVQAVFEEWLKMPGLLPHYVGLSVPGVHDGFLWTIFTYGFLHGQIASWGVLHIGFNMLMLYMLGREVLPVLGPRRFLGFYAGALIASALMWLAVALAIGSPGTVVGASGVVFGVLVVWAYVASDQPRTFLLFFILPVTVRPKTIAMILGGITLVSVLFLEIPGRQGVAYSAHLGGMLAGWLYYRFLFDRASRADSGRPVIEVPAWMRRRKPRAVAGTYRVNLSEPQDVRAEVDRVLDKINSQGFGALTDEERRILDEARDVLNKR